MSRTVYLQKIGNGMQITVQKLENVNMTINCDTINKAMPGFGKVMISRKIPQHTYLPSIRRRTGFLSQPGLILSESNEGNQLPQ